MLEEYESVIAKNTQLFLNIDPDTTLDSILSYAEDLGCKEYTISKYKYKIKLPILNTKGQKVEIKVELFKVDQEKICADFTKIDGDYQVFVDEFNAIRSYLAGGGATENEEEQTNVTSEAVTAWTKNSIKKHIVYLINHAFSIH